MYIKKVLTGSFTRFIIIGGTATCIDFTIYMLLSQWISFSYAKAISMIISCVFSFFINKKWTFHDKEAINTIKISKYVISQGINIVINVSMNAFVLEISNIKILAFIIATATAMVANFLLQKNFVFKGGI